MPTAVNVLEATTSVNTMVRTPAASSKSKLFRLSRPAVDTVYAPTCRQEIFLIPFAARSVTAPVETAKKVVDTLVAILPLILMLDTSPGLNLMYKMLRSAVAVPEVSCCDWLEEPAEQEARKVSPAKFTEFGLTGSSKVTVRVLVWRSSVYPSKVGGVVSGTNETQVALILTVFPIGVNALSVMVFWNR